MYDTAMFKAHPIFNSSKRNSTDPSIRDRSRTLIGVGLSVLVHALLLFIVIRHSMENEGGPRQPEQGPLVVRFTQALAPPPRAVVLPPDRNSKPHTPRKQRAVIALQKPTLQAPPIAVEPPEPVPEPNSLPQPDMMAMIDAARERRSAANHAAERDNAEAQAGNGVPSTNDIVMANINHSLQAQSSARYGTSGVFQILSMGARMAEFSFRGWTSDSRKSWRQVIEVDAGPQGDVELAVVRKMIELIRSHFDGDFNWESHRLGRVVVLSARISDNAGLENFMVREFFSVR
jgi:hypothetical protein